MQAGEAGAQVGALVPPPSDGKGGRVVSGPSPERFGDPSAKAANGMEQLRAMLENMNGNLAKMTGSAPVNATITDARQDNRSYTNNISTSVVQNVTTAVASAAAAGAVGSAVGRAVGQAAVNQASRIEQEPAQP